MIPKKPENINYTKLKYQVILNFKVSVCGRACKVNTKRAKWITGQFKSNILS